MNTQSVSYIKMLQVTGRATLVILLACMPWAALSPAASPPARWAALMHMAAMAVLSLWACVSFATLWGQAGAVMFVFANSGLMELLQHFSPVRTGSWEDVVMNALGCLAGLVIFFVFSVMFKTPDGGT